MELMNFWTFCPKVKKGVLNVCQKKEKAADTANRQTESIGCPKGSS